MQNNALAEKTQTLHGATQASKKHILFNHLLMRHANDMHRYAYWLAGDKQTAEDLVQEALLRAWKSLDRLQDIKAAKGWLLTILRRENARRFERYQPKVSDIPMDELGDHEHSYDTSTEAFVLRRAIDELPEEYRTPLLKQVVEGFSQKEIAQQIGISSAGVGTRLFRARQKLRLALAS
ncbi:MAG: sigma-70 family RNA polymerase sigma factor [Chromatiaceae bacterium]|nr:sigma-70 family RNA polymerase sigma factor [Gammaproteobacteria bacterium]MCB1880323.1 sigma-70 family RNA polymerase sigma factor [Gammaproteobacteria bacterium]MCP5428150.1 sigma-70 family RNA polymerase sigma factor [Chromatiaceae bacterium]MCP5447074.1 sigma-70 family RNA polymerase sigma factor [Chromatiaceae bacterium]